MNEPTKGATNNLIEQKIKSWLRHARDRDGGRKQRYKLALAKQSQSVDDKLEISTSETDIED
jgi:hypothetical protein